MKEKYGKKTENRRMTSANAFKFTPRKELLNKNSKDVMSIENLKFFANLPRNAILLLLFKSINGQALTIIKFMLFSWHS